MMMSCLPSLIFLFCTLRMGRAPAVEIFPKPFTRTLKVTTPPLSGRDVVILQNLLRRVEDHSSLPTTGVFDENTETALKSFQAQVGLALTGILNGETAEEVLKVLMSDGYKDDGQVPPGYKYKFFIPVHKNRDIETNGSLLDSEGNVVHVFRVRAHGALDGNGAAINQLTTNGNTVTGLMTSDLNSKEPNPKAFGPYPVVRCVKGLKGNAAIGKNANDTFISNYRSGILIHTGEWEGWSPSQNMPNSQGCMHVHPDDMKILVDQLTNLLSVTVNENPFGTSPYPYEPQGIVSIEQID